MRVRLDDWRLVQVVAVLQNGACDFVFFEFVLAVCLMSDCVTFYNVVRIIALPVV